jgi:CheY-like chemotaxis protein
MLDPQMPRLTGVEAAVAIRAAAPALPIIVSSGYLGDHERATLCRLPVTSLLHKPYTLPDLRAALLPHLKLASLDVDVACVR